jgi:hypothetical protein
MKIYSDYAREKMVKLFNSHEDEVGSELKRQYPEKYKDYKSTDCITYSLNVISYAFEKSGNSEAAKHVWSLGRRGVDLAKYLVNTHSWKGVYINPDSVHPADAQAEHTFSSHLASRTCKYYQIPLQFRVDNYAPTPRTNPAYRQLNRNAGVTSLNKVDIASLEQVKFGFGLSRGGMHTWVFSKGKVYEVHWDKFGSDLYEATSLRRFPWLSGAIVIPGDQGAFLSASSKLKCGG